MQPLQPLHPVRSDIDLGLAQQLIHEKTTAHADLAVNAPD
jgi:hypothetical protein